MAGKYFEDISIGDRFKTQRRTITETDMVSFRNLIGMFEDLFLDREYVESQTPFKKPIAPGALTFSFAEGLVALLHLFQGTAIGLLGVDELRVPAPVFCDDTIYVEIEITGKRESKKPDRGIIEARQTVKNQRGETVMHFNVARMLRRRQ